jgi:RNA recognition motif-containing protein
MADVEVKQEAAYEPESHALPTPQAETAPLSPGTSPTPSHTYNVFVGDLAPNITESLLRSHFSQYGDIKLVNIIRDKVTGACKGYAFVHFATQEAREKALAPENSSPIIGGQAARVKPSDEKTTLLITNVPAHMGIDDLSTEFNNLLSGVTGTFRIDVKVPGSVILAFDTFDVANMAKKALMNAPLGGKQITATWAEAGTRQVFMPIARGVDTDPLHVTTLHVSNIAMTANEEDLRNLFARFGEVSRPVIVKNAMGEKRGFGFVTLPDRDACMAAMRELDQTEFQGQRIGVSLAKTTSGSATSTIGNREGGRFGGGSGGGGGGGGGRGGRSGPDRYGRYDRYDRYDSRDGRGGGGGDRYRNSSPYGQPSSGYSAPYGQPPSYPPAAYPSYPSYSYPPAPTTAASWSPYGAYPDPNAAYVAPPPTAAPTYPSYPPYDPNAAYYASSAPPPASQPPPRYY